jgi:hypothetical protein
LEKKDIDAIAHAIGDRNIMVLSDEIYSQLIFEGEEHSIMSIDGMKERTILLDGFSKTYAMTGWRMGYGVMRADLATHISRLMTNSNSCTASFTQIAGVEALRGSQKSVDAMRAEFKKRRDVMVAGLNKIKGFTCRVPHGAFYVFPNITKTGWPSKKLADALLADAGVAGLSAIATAKRLGAVVRAYDVRPACREQVESLGSKFVELPLETSKAEGAGGYAQVQDEAFYQRQRELLGNVVAESDVVISTAAIPGKQSPLLVTAEAVARMQPGSVIIDLGAERGGNCALTKANERVVAHGVTILGPTNLPSEVPYHASQMFSANVTAFLLNLVKKGELEMNMEDPIIRDTLVAQNGEVVNSRIRELLGMKKPQTA